MTYELLLETFSMKKLNSPLYRNCSANLSTAPPEPTRAGMPDPPLPAAHHGPPQTTRSPETETMPNAESTPCQSEAPHGRCDLGPSTSAAAASSGGATIVKKSCNPQPLQS